MITSSLRRRRPLVAVAAVTGALLLGGCSGSGSGSDSTAAEPEETYAPDRLHAQIPSHIAVKVGAAMRGLTQVRVTGEVVEGDLRTTVDLALDQDSCEATHVDDLAEIQVRVVEERIYLKGDAGFWTYVEKHLDSPRSAVRAYSDRWVETKEFGGLCAPTFVSDLVPSFDVKEVSEPMVHDGVEAVVITTTDGDRMVAANEAPYRVLQLETSDSDVQFSYDDVVVTDEVPDGVVTMSEAFELPPFEIA